MTILHTGRQIDSRKNKKRAFDVDSRVGGYKRHLTILDLSICERCANRVKVADYIGGVDFRDGTGPSALLPNDVARAFRDAEDFALLGRGQELWSRLTGDDRGRDQHHPRAGGEGSRAGVGRVGKGGGRGVSASGRRRRVVHVESATTGKFFKVSCYNRDDILELVGGYSSYLSNQSVIHRNVACSVHRKSPKLDNGAVQSSPWCL